jgi:P27 family predicted phage terminase small subunit
MGGKGSGGKNKKTTERKIAEGNRGKRELDLRSSVALPGEPNIPSCLNKEGRKVWPEVCETLAANGVLFKTDGIAIAALCSSLVLFAKADAAIYEFGALHASVDETTGVGVLRTAPAVRVRSDALRHLRACWQAFGLDPVSRSGLDVAKKPEAPKEGALDGILRSKKAKKDDKDDFVM